VAYGDREEKENYGEKAGTDGGGRRWCRACASGHARIGALWLVSRYNA